MINKRDMSEEDIKRLYITPAIESKGWKDYIRMEHYFTDGKVMIKTKKRENAYKADYILYYNKNLPIAIVEAKDNKKEVGAGLQQALKYGKILDVPFVYSSNGDLFVEHDNFTGKEKVISLKEFPTRNELWERYKKGRKIDEKQEKIITEPYYFNKGDKTPRYYQEIAINRTIEAIAKGEKRILLVMATGTGKTYTAFQIIYRLRKSGAMKKILFLADRNILVDQTMSQDFKPFRKVMTKIEGKKLDSAYEIYLGLYQQLAGEEGEEPFRMFKSNFFDLIIIDECHRGSAKEDSSWRKILDYFSEATHIGLTATPKETKDVSSKSYFGEPIYTYSLKQGIQDGFLAPYNVIRIHSDIDVSGYTTREGEYDLIGNLLTDNEYTVADFDKKIVIEERTKYVARKISNYLKEHDRFSKTIVFCTDIDHADRMRRAIINENQDLVKEDSRYVMKITGDDKEGKSQLDNFIDVYSKYPVIVTTSKLLTTGVDCKTCNLIVLDTNINSMTEFKQIIGRGTRLYPEFNKYYFTILDFKGATRLFFDPDFDGEPESIIDDDGKCRNRDKKPRTTQNDEDDKVKKFYVEGDKVDTVLLTHSFLDENGNLVINKVIDHTKTNIKGKYATLEEFLNIWNKSKKKIKILQELKELDINLDVIKDHLNLKNVDDFDVICHVAYKLKPLTRSERIKKVKLSEMYKEYSHECRNILNALLEKYNDNGLADLESIEILKNEPFREYGNPMFIANLFGGKEGYLNMIQKVENQLYAS